jgi:FAD/FMN-containing dehydrogenase
MPRLTRRDLLARGLQLGAAAAFLPACTEPAGEEAGVESPGVWVNDIHSQLNRTRVLRVEQPSTAEAVADVVRRAARDGRAVSIAGGRHAMGGQQFGTDTALLDIGGLTTLGELDGERGEIEVGAGVLWPSLVTALLERQQGAARQWGIVQKQTGADRLTIGGALAANAHGRGLTYAPIVQDVAAFTLVDAQGEIRRCSRTENPELFRLAIGGYGLFGVITSVRLRLAPRRRIERVVEVTDVAGVADRFRSRIADGYLFGDFQYSTDVGSETLLRRGVFACYRPVGDDVPMPETQAELSRENWLDLLQAAHLDRAAAFQQYAAYYQSTSGQLYWSDTHQLSEYIDDYHRILGERLGAFAQGTEMISELYVPREALAAFLEAVRQDFVEHQVNLIYGTIRLIERDEETMLAWARESWACVIFNLHTAHDQQALDRTASHFRRLIDRARAHGGSYFLTYHRWATREQVLACYPQLPEFLVLKRKHDPQERFQSDWYRHYREMFES